MQPIATASALALVEWTHALAGDSITEVKMLNEMQSPVYQAGRANPGPSPRRAFDDAQARVAKINLTMVKLKLMDPEEGEAWHAEFVDEVERRYRRFLCMIFVHGNESIVPTKDIDTFWHQHILDTRAYLADCLSVFGEFVHHYPYFGMSGEQDERDLAESFENTKRIYANAFREDYLAGGTTNGKCCRKCGSRCGSSKCHHPRTN